MTAFAARCRIDDYRLDLGVWPGAGDGNRTRIVSLGMCIRGMTGFMRGLSVAVEVAARSAESSAIRLW
jgi:hypothetical protein